LVDITLSGSVPAINHTDGEREVTVSADVSGGQTAGAVVSQLKTRLNGDVLDGNVSASFGGESQDVQESFTDLFVSMIVGVILIFALLTFQFSSYRQPLYMIATIPLALIGVFYGLSIVGQPLSFPAFIGVVALAGIVVNNAIILIDRINKNRAEGDSKNQAIYQACRSRLQPILLTTITTVGGMIPLLFADPTWAPLAYTIIFGLLFATVLTLVVVPLLYQRFE
jgi:multidrug efflux pump subunit AcrB